MIKRNKAKEYVSYVVDDAGEGRRIHDDIHAIVREKGGEYEYPSVLVGWQCGFEPLFVAVHSYLDVKLNDGQAVEMATEYLVERDWFAGESREPDYVIR